MVNLPFLMPPSHEYHFAFRDLLRLVAGPLAVLAAFTLLVHLGSFAGFLPAPYPALDLDRTILAHQARACRQANPARVILIGDSSALMNVSAIELARHLGEPVQNLATLSYVNLSTHGRMLATYLATNPGPATVILLMHPESLRLASRPEYFSKVIGAELEGTDAPDPSINPVMRFFGVDRFRNRILARALLVPLPGAYGEFYGFTRDLWNHMTAHRGSAIDPREYKPEGTAEYRLAEQVKPAAEDLRRWLPAGTKLLAGLTPSPEGFVLPNHEATCARILAEWSGWLRADSVLNLPLTLPDRSFASTTHLNQEGVPIYTRQLAEALRISVASQ